MSSTSNTIMDPTQTNRTQKPHSQILSGSSPAERLGLAEFAPSLEMFQKRLDTTAEQVWTRLRQNDSLRPLVIAPPQLEQPLTFAELFAAAIAIERSENSAESAQREHVMLRHHLEWMPALRAEALATTAAPLEPLFHTHLDPTKLPRLFGGLSQMIALLESAHISPTDIVGVASAAQLFQERPTLAELYAPTYFGGCMPMLYASPADLDAYSRELALPGAELHALIDCRLTASLLHEHLHFGRKRNALLPHYMDECIAGYLGVLVLPDFAWPEDGEDNALFGAPWFAQVGQFLCRAVGLSSVLRAHVGELSWSEALPSGFEIAAERIGWEQYRAGREPHLLTGNTKPELWITLISLAASGHDVSDMTLSDVGDVALMSVPMPDPNEEDTEILRGALKTMCLHHHLDGNAHRIRSAPPTQPIVMDLEQCRVRLENAATGPLQVPTYLFPPALAAKLRSKRVRGVRLELRALDAVDEVLEALEAGDFERSGVGYTLAALSDPCG